jgi:hypothetical protein
MQKPVGGLSQRRNEGVGSLLPLFSTNSMLKTVACRNPFIFLYIRGAIEENRKPVQNRQNYWSFFSSVLSSSKFFTMASACILIHGLSDSISETTMTFFPLRLA